jgi:hypothetical protein
MAGEQVGEGVRRKGKSAGREKREERKRRERRERTERTRRERQPAMDVSQRGARNLPRSQRADR